MTIGLFTDTYPPDINGVATSVATLFDEFQKLGHTVYVVTTNLPKHHKIEIQGHIIRIPGFTLKKIYSYRITNFFSIKVNKYLDKIPFDVIHVNTESTIGIFGRRYARSKNLPLIYTYHSLYSDFTTTIAKENSTLDNFLKKMVESITIKLAKSPTEFITPSIKSALVLRKYGITRYINIIPNGIDLSEYRYLPYSQEKIDLLKKKYGLEGKKILIVVGRLGQEKGIDRVLACLRYYINDTLNENIRLLIIGDGPYKEELKAKVSELYLNPYVLFTGKIPHDQIYLFYQLADVLLSGSKSETQGLTLNEAMASKCLVLTIEDESFKYALKEGETGFFYTSPITFTEKLKTIFALTPEKKEEILTNAYNINKEICSPTRYAKEVLEVYEKAQRRCW